MTNLYSILKSRDIALLTNVGMVKVMVFSAVKYRCESWTIKKAEIEVKVKVAQLCLTLRNLTDYPVHGILQARILAWVAFPFTRGSSWPRNQTQVSHIAGGFFIYWAIREALFQERSFGTLWFIEWFDFTLAQLNPINISNFTRLKEYISWDFSATEII